MNNRIIFRQALKLTQANLKTRYRNTWSGALWVFFNPLLIFGAQSYAFHYILKINMEKYPLFLLTGLLPWIFITSSIDMATSSLLTHGRLLKSFPISPAGIIVAQIADNFVNYLATFLLLLIPISFWMSWPLSNFIFMILPFISLFVFVTAFCFLAASVNVFWRDTRFVLSFALQVTYFITPIFYPEQLIPEHLRWIVTANIFYAIIRPYHLLVSSFTLQSYAWAVVQSFAISFALAALSIYFWRRKRNEIYFYL